MSDPVRVLHYMNQFFGGLGAEDQAWAEPRILAGSTGPGVMLDREMGAAGSVVATITCGDNFFTEQSEVGLAAVLTAIERYHPDVVVAGPAFAAGRYGLACGSICSEVGRRLGLPTVTAMNSENPAVDLFRRETYILPTAPSVLGMQAAMRRLAVVAVKLAQHEPLGSAATEGYFPRGIRRNVAAGRPAAERAVAMLLQKVQGQPFQTELVPSTFDAVSPAPPVSHLPSTTIAFVTEAAIVPKGNPGRMPVNRAIVWQRYDIHDLRDLTSDTHESVHSGFNVQVVNEDPDRMVPLDALRTLQEAGEVGPLYPDLLVTAGSVAVLTHMRRIGAEMAKDLRSAGVGAVVLPAT